MTWKGKLYDEQDDFSGMIQKKEIIQGLAMVIHMLSAYFDMVDFILIFGILMVVRMVRKSFADHKLELCYCTLGGVSRIAGI